MYLKNSVDWAYFTHVPITVDIILDNDDKVQNIEQQLRAEIEEIKKKMAKEIDNLRMALEESKLKGYN